MKNKLIGLLALCLMVMSGCQKMEDRILDKEVENLKFSFAYAKGCMTGALLANPTVPENPLAAMQLAQYCAGTADQYGESTEKVRSIRYSCELGCIRSVIGTAGQPKSEEQRQYVLNGCKSGCEEYLSALKDSK